MLSIQNVTHTYPNGVQALKGVTLTIEKGMFGLLGPNGAGKSSLMRSIATLQQPTQGAVSFDGIDVLEEPMALRRVLGYLPQDFGVYPRGSAYHLLDHLAVLKGFSDRRERKNIVDHLLAETNLYGVRHKRVATFSGGMRRRFGIAQALIGDPKLIIVDEPTAGLDPEERNRFHNLLAEIGEDRVVLLSTHIIEDVTELCASMAILAAGRVLVQGKPAELIQRLNGRVWTKHIDKSEKSRIEHAFHVISSHLFAGRTLVRVIAADRPGPDFDPAEANLADVYFSALKGEQSRARQAV
ncbi:ABC transporter ATP-binding protein [Acanthopleuribacter pedis]|uniref:ABC transporter ATP-binding protein n=1 Tax=Acanthopleuribacter pedis TaxID=442870 RepID=A0A8J7U4I7_9BACT|nr:ABC transporter ATP-binding protein [Acanthopleuribacter pedis]MBO1319483.1 ABC transporter ATP-binding protein [Acanthopleuribacter pedis]